MSRTLILCMQFPIVTTILWGQLSLGSSLIIFSSFLFFRSLVKNKINIGQPIPLMWYIFILLFFKILALENIAKILTTGPRLGTASWQNHDISPPKSVILLHCHGCLCLSNTSICSALWRQCKSKITAHLPGYPRPAQGLV